MPSSAPKPESLHLHSDGCTPNSQYPVLIYRALPFPPDNCADHFERLFASHLWPAQWRSVVFSHDHYHSTAHEVLGIARGAARLMLGGERGVTVDVRARDAIILPAGTGHRLLSASPDLMVVGGYPLEQISDSMLPESTTHDDASVRIAQVTIPVVDPIAGSRGELVSLWRQSGLGLGTAARAACA